MMKTDNAVVDRCPDTGLYVGTIAGFPGAHTQAATIEELTANLNGVVAMILEDGAHAAHAEPARDDPRGAIRSLRRRPTRALPGSGSGECGGSTLRLPEAV